MKYDAGSVDICGVSFTVYLADEKGEPELKGNYGLCRVECQEIYIVTGLSKDLTYFYIIHEALHAIFAHIGLGVIYTAGRTKVNKEEILVRAMTPACLQLIASLPNLSLL